MPGPLEYRYSPCLALSLGVVFFAGALVDFFSAAGAFSRAGAAFLAAGFLAGDPTGFLFPAGFPNGWIAWGELLASRLFSRSWMARSTSSSLTPAREA